MKLVEHLKDRGMDPSLYRVFYSYSASTISFLLFNLSGELCGYQQYRPDKTSKKNNHPKMGRYFTYLPRMKDGYFGLELLDNTKKDLFVVEGVFKAGKLHRLGFNAIAVLGNAPKRSKTLFRILKRQYNLIAIGDNDKASNLLINAVGKGFKSPIDLDEMTDGAVLELLKENVI